MKNKNLNGPLRRHLIHAILLGIVLSLTWAGLVYFVLKSPARQSYDYWTAEASPWRIASQYQAEDSKLQVIELVNGAGGPLFLEDVELNGTNGNSSLPTHPSIRFESKESMTLLLPLQTGCQANETYQYSLHITYSGQENASASETEDGRLPVYGICE